MTPVMIEAVPMFRRRLAWSIGLLTVASLVIFATLAVMFTQLDERQRSNATSTRESALWAAFQADREAYRFAHAVAEARVDPSPEALEAVMLRYDVLFSRGNDLEVVIGGVPFADPEPIKGEARSTATKILALAPTIDALVSDPALFVAELPDLSAQAIEIRQASAQLALEANNATNDLRVLERQTTQRAYHTIALGVLILVVALGLLVALLIVQLAHTARTGRRLKDLSERNARAAEAAEAGNRAKSAFLATMSHEIRTPLNGIIGMADILAAETLNPEQREQIALIRQSGDLLLDVINDVLDFSKLEAGHVDITPVTFDLPDLFEGLRRIMAPRAEAKSLGFHVDVPPVTITTDPTLLRQVVTNLLGNAIKFTERGEVRLTAEIRDGTHLRVMVADTGIGIPPKAMSRLFQEFNQVDASMTRRFGGTGLGLAICRRLVEALGGKIDAASIPGFSSRFWFDIPAAPVQESRRLRALPAPDAVQSRFSGRVLVVEDNPVNRKVACGMLAAAGLDADYAEDGCEALARTADRSYDLILMDMQMPVMDGLAATRALRGRGYTAPIMGLTANAFVSDREACLAAGMDDFVSKPITRAKLHDALGRWLKPAKRDVPQLPAAPVAKPVSQALTAVDTDQRAALADALGAEEVATLVRDFFAEAARRLTETRAAVASGDAEAADAALHTLKGAALTLGFAGIGTSAQAARTAPPAEAARYLAEIDDALAALAAMERGVAA